MNATEIRRLADEYRGKRWLSPLSSPEANRIHALVAVQLDEIAAYVEAELATAGRAAEPLQWQPIATAPKDGTEVLLTDGARSYKRVGYWARRREVWSVDTAVTVSPPTHWAPIPPDPPSRGDAER